MKSIGLIGGTGLDNWDFSEAKLQIETPFGSTSSHVSIFDFRLVAFCLSPDMGLPIRFLRIRSITGRIFLLCVRPVLKKLFRLMPWVEFPPGFRPARWSYRRSWWIIPGVGHTLSVTILISRSIILISPNPFHPALAMNCWKPVILSAWIW